MDANRYVSIVGRLMIGLPFAMSGFGKLATYGKTTAAIAAVGLPLPPLAYALAVAIELGGGLLLAVGYQSRIMAVALAVFSIVAAISFHNNFRRPEPDDPFPQECDDRGRVASDRCVRWRSVESRSLASRGSGAFGGPGSLTGWLPRYSVK